jgi:2-(3-amino-3-carboxypropyl)histidine synthase
LENKELNEAIKVLPPNYNFEIHKTVWRIEEVKKAANKDVSLKIF